MVCMHPLQFNKHCSSNLMSLNSCQPSVRFSGCKVCDLTRRAAVNVLLCVLVSAGLLLLSKSRSSDLKFGRSVNVPSFPLSGHTFFPSLNCLFSFSSILPLVLSLFNQNWLRTQSDVQQWLEEETFVFTLWWPSLLLLPSHLLFHVSEKVIWGVLMYSMHACIHQMCIF